LDAVEALNHASGVEQGPAESVAFVPTLVSHPNPFQTSTIISLSYPETGIGHPASLSIYDVSGRLVKTFTSHQPRVTSYEFVWDGTDSQGKNLPGGVYFYRLNSSPFTATEKVVLIR
jgi:hypothetical protein